jgi:hypothetical protein
VDITLPVDEALALAAAREPLPPLVRSVRAVGSTVHAEIDLRLIPDPPTALRFAAAAVGVVSVAARFTGYVGGVATFEISAQARAIPAHKLLNHVTGPVNTALAKKGLPDGLVEVRRGTDEPVLALRVQDAVASRVEGVTVTGLDVVDGALRVSASVGTVALR